MPPNVRRMPAYLFNDLLDIFQHEVLSRYRFHTRVARENES